MPKTVTLPVDDLVALELLLIPLATYAESEAKTLDEIGLPLCAQNARKAAAQARHFREAIRAGGETIRLTTRSLK